MGDVIKFYCACGQKVGVPRGKIGTVGHCPQCNSPLEVPQEGTDPGGEKVYAAVKLEVPAEEVARPEGQQGGPPKDCRSCGAALPLLAIRCPDCGADVLKSVRPRATTRRRKRDTRQQQTRMVVRDEAAVEGRLPLWFWLSFSLDAALFVACWQFFDQPWYYGLLLGQIGGWTLRVIGFKLRL